MGSNYLCTIQRARHPFYVESIGINIYSAEELCYYLYHNVYLIDDTIISERLCDWLGEELKLEKARSLMLRALTHNEGVTAFFQPLLQECSYLTEEEIHKFQDDLLGLQVESEDVRRKMKADYLTKNGLYISAISEYDKILEKKSGGRLEMQFYAEVLENMAASYARLFRFEEAAGCLWESYQNVRSRSVYEKYVKLLSLYLSPEKYEQRMAQLKESKEDTVRMAKAAEALLLEGGSSDLARTFDQADPENMIEALRQLYVRNTTGTR